jgi:EamA domain-containing membrane protein RarD
VFLARRLTRGPRAALIGVAVGVTYACTAALIKSCTNIVLRGLPALLTSWQLYALIVTGVAGLALNQLAFQAGPLHASLPAIATVDPLLSVALGVLVYDERLRSGAGAWIAEAACLAALAAAALFLSRVPQESPRSSSLEHSQT